MASLYEIDYQIRSLLDSIIDTADENGEVGEIDFSQLEQLNQERQQKMENIALYIKNLESDAEAIKAEEANLKARRTSLENKANRLRELMIKSMTEHNEQELSSARYQAKIKTSEATDIIDLNRIPKKYIIVKKEFQPDKKAIKAAIKEGKKVAGAVIKTNISVNIK